MSATSLEQIPASPSLTVGLAEVRKSTERVIVRIAAGTALALGALGLTGCAAHESDPTPSPSVTETSAQAIDPSATPSATEAEGYLTPTQVQEVLKDCPSLLNDQFFVAAIGELPKSTAVPVYESATNPPGAACSGAEYLTDAWWTQRHG